MKKKLSPKIVLYSLTIISLLFQVGCSADRNKAEEDAEMAFNDFKEYVTSTETTVNSQTAITPAEWAKTLAAARVAYDEKVAKLNQFEGEYNEMQQEEIADLKNRFNLYWQQREVEFENRISTNSSGNYVASGVAEDFKVAEVVSISPAYIRLAYVNLVNRVQANKDIYTPEDWEIINTYYKSLEERENTVQNELSEKDKYDIAKAKARYISLRTAARIDSEVSKTVEVVKGAASTTGQKVEAKNQRFSAQVKSAVKTSEEKLGNAARKANSEVKSTTSKVTRNIDSKIDTNSNKD